jgi:hypothetical protein
MKENKMSPPAVYCTLCGSPFQTIECEEDAASPSALADTAWLEKARLLGRSYGGFSGTLLSRTCFGARRLQGYDCWEVGRRDEVSFNLTLQDPAGVEVDEEVK